MTLRNTWKWCRNT